MRDIKFRGKRLYNDEWVYGFVAKIDCYENGKQYKETVIVDQLKYDDRDYYVQEFIYADAVDTDTVGQYTGLKDKNGKDIYEGDILHKDFYWGWYVEFEDGAFCRIPTNKVQRINWTHYRMNQNGVKDWEVIGNIYDNPELIDPIEIEKGDRIAQMVIVPYARVEIEEADELSETERGEDGFGSTGR